MAYEVMAYARGVPPDTPFKSEPSPVAAPAYIGMAYIVMAYVGRYSYRMYH